MNWNDNEDQERFDYRHGTPRKQRRTKHYPGGGRVGLCRLVARALTTDPDEVNCKRCRAILETRVVDAW
jgi:hypothetical protein